MTRADGCGQKVRTWDQPLMQAGSMITKTDLPQLVLEALKALGGSGTVVEVSRQVWDRHESGLHQSGDLFYTWQYDLRWAAQRLRDERKLAPSKRGAASRWTMV